MEPEIKLGKCNAVTLLGLGSLPPLALLHLCVHKLCLLWKTPPWSIRVSRSRADIQILCLEFLIVLSLFL